eukprot:1154042-Pelagomonas_calceolata.AAC.3
MQSINTAIAGLLGCLFIALHGVPPRARRLHACASWGNFGEGLGWEETPWRYPTNLRQSTLPLRGHINDANMIIRLKSKSLPMGLEGACFREGCADSAGSKH